MALSQVVSSWAKNRCKQPNCRSTEIIFSSTSHQASTDKFSEGWRSFSASGMEVFMEQ
jgi:hypothetical protein